MKPRLRPRDKSKRVKWRITPWDKARALAEIYVLNNDVEEVLIKYRNLIGLNGLGRMRASQILREWFLVVAKRVEHDVEFRDFVNSLGLPIKEEESGDSGE